MGAGAFRLPKRGRARLVVVAVAAMLVAGTGVLQMWPASAAGPSIDTNINDYTLFALNRLDIKGGNGSVSEIGGNIGVKNADANPNDGTPSIGICRGGAGHPVHMADGSQIVG